MKVRKFMKTFISLLLITEFPIEVRGRTDNVRERMGDLTSESDNFAIVKDNTGAPGYH
jgi:hypothetical protein